MLVRVVSMVKILMRMFLWFIGMTVAKVIVAMYMTM
jgi:hypothetical protein